jgi:hypothetical protein
MVFCAAAGGTFLKLSSECHALFAYNRHTKQLAAVLTTVVCVLVGALSCISHLSFKRSRSVDCS